MKFWTRFLTLSTLLAVSATTFAQEAEATDAPVAEGLGLGMILLAVVMIAVVGFVMYQRENGDDDGLI